jgi:hypothetical protein
MVRPINQAELANDHIMTAEKDLGHRVRRGRSTPNVGPPRRLSNRTDTDITLHLGATTETTIVLQNFTASDLDAGDFIF